MSNDSQGPFPRLAIMGSYGKKMRKKLAGLHGMEHAKDGGQPDEQTACRMAVMPRMRRRWVAPMLSLAWNRLRGFFMMQPDQRRRAAVLSFRRQDFRSHTWPQACAAGVVPGKKPNGSIGWQEQMGAPKEEGRG